MDKIFCLALCRNVIQKIPTQALKTGEATGNKLFKGACKVMLVEGSFSCPTSSDRLSALLALDVDPPHCEPAHTEGPRASTCSAQVWLYMNFHKWVLKAFIMETVHAF